MNSSDWNIGALPWLKIWVTDIPFSFNKPKKTKNMSDKTQNTLQPEIFIKQVLHDVVGFLPPSSITESKRLKVDLIMDSMDFMTVISEIEKHFEIELPSDEVAKLETVNDLVQLTLKVLHTIE